MRTARVAISAFAVLAAHPAEGQNAKAPEPARSPPKASAWPSPVPVEQQRGPLAVPVMGPRRLQRLIGAATSTHAFIDGDSIALVAMFEGRITLATPAGGQDIFIAARAGAPFDDPDFGISPQVWLERDQVAFRAESGHKPGGSLAAGPVRCGIYVASPKGIQEVASSRTLAPDSGKPFSCMSNPVLRGGTVYFPGAVGNDWTGIYAWKAGHLRAVVSMSTLLPDGRKFRAGFSYLSGQGDQLRASAELDKREYAILGIDDRDRFSFLARADGGGWPLPEISAGVHEAWRAGRVGYGPKMKGDRIAFLGQTGTDADPDLRACVIGVRGGATTRFACLRDRIDGATVLGLSLSDQPFDATGVVFTVQRSDGRYGIYRGDFCAKDDHQTCATGNTAAIAR